MSSTSNPTPTVTVDGTSSLGTQLSAGRYLDVLLSDPAQPLIASFVGALLGSDTKTPSESQTYQNTHDEITTIGLCAFNAFLQANVTGPVLDTAAVQRVDDVLLQVSPTKEGVSKTQRLSALRRACFKSLDVDGVSVYPYIPNIELFCLARFIFTSTSSSITATTHVLQLTEKDGQEQDIANRSLAWLALRIHVWHYKLITQPSLGPGSVFTKGAQWSDVPSLQHAVDQGLEALEKEVLIQDGGWNAREKAQFLVEKANVCIMLGQDVKAREALRQATSLNGLVYALSGALGKRTKFQQNSTSQLVVLAKSGEANETANGTDKEAREFKPQSVALNDDTLLESLEFTRERVEDLDAAVDKKVDVPEALKDISPNEQPQLSPLDQIILLTEATLKDSFSPADTLNSEEILPYAVRVISDKSTNWQIYTQALLVRSRIEMHRSRTIERGVLQMQAVVDQVIVDTTSAPAKAEVQKETKSKTDIPTLQVTGDGEQANETKDLAVSNKPTSFFPVAKPTESAPAQVRLQYIHVLSSPPRWHLESELAYSWAGVGSLVSALEIFKRLRLWAEVALCLASNAAREDEDGRGSGGEAKAKAIVRWRLFRPTGSSADETTDDELDEDIDVSELSESDFQGPERSPPPFNAPRLFCILGDLEDEPAYYERAWEISKLRFSRAQRSLGEHYIKQQELKKACDAYKKAVAVNRLSSDMWNRLGDISLRLGEFSDAVEAFGRAIACADNNIGGSDDARTWSNLGSALYSLYVERVKELKAEKEAKKEQAEEAPTPVVVADDEEVSTEERAAPRSDPATLLSQSLAAYKRGASTAHDNWRIWDNVITLGSRLRPVAVSDIVLALQNVIRIRATEDALDLDVLRLLLNEAVLSQPKTNEKTTAYDSPRGSLERSVCELLEKSVAPIITTRSELWEIIVRERVWRRDYAGAIDAAEKAWRAAVGGAIGGLSAASDGKTSWLESKEGFQTVLERTEELISALENYGDEVPEIGSKWKGKARSAVRSVMGKAKENWEGSEEWEKLTGLLEGLSKQPASCLLLHNDNRDNDRLDGDVEAGVLALGDGGGANIRIRRGRGHHAAPPVLRISSLRGIPPPFHPVELLDRSRVIPVFRHFKSVQDVTLGLSSDKINDILLDLRASNSYPDLINFRLKFYRTAKARAAYACTQSSGGEIPKRFAEYCETHHEYLEATVEEEEIEKNRLNNILTRARMLVSSIKSAAEGGSLEEKELGALKVKVETLRTCYPDAYDAGNWINSNSRTPVDNSPGAESGSHTRAFINFIVPTVSLLACIPEVLAWWRGSPEPGYFEDADFLQLIAGSAMQ
ncbi:hypothetical protein B0H63DRAFT_537826 [Podospora didyma]|uniref:TPR repeat-containing protein n=1 Tax=Podospora didyma TaxID=330526 RepID=A0AAE0NY53_9PEZI|nr:hypothetical protein B0H63DRAFT_537826 [Podospora didyma]